MRVALFITCFNDTLFPGAGKAVVKLLERLGCSVEFPLEQTCCGQMHVNSGYEHEAGGLLDRFARVFGDYDAVVSPSASCVAHVRERIESVGVFFGHDLRSTVYSVLCFVMTVTGVCRY